MLIDVLWLTVTATAAPANVGPEAAAMLEKIEARKGICAVLGLPTSGRPSFVVDLARATELTFYFQSPDGGTVARVRGAAESAGLLGRRIFVDRGAWHAIHLADNLAGAVIVAGSVKGAVARDEILRVLHPAGKAIVGKQQIVKPFPKGIDHWSYPHHGPDNNPHSTDQLARAPYLTQFIAEPKFAPSPAVTVAAGGRVFKAFGHLAHKSNQNAVLNTLLAVNAYNGTVLWKRSLRPGFMILRNTFVATADTVYLADDESCKLLDAATGRLKDEIVASESDDPVWKWMAVRQGMLYGLVGEEEVEAPVLRSDRFGLGHWPRANWPGFDYKEAATAWGQGRTWLAISLKTKRVVWRHRETDHIDARAVCMRGSRLYFLSPMKFLACLDSKDGQLMWRTTDPKLLEAIGPRFAEKPRWTGLSPMVYVKCNDSYLFFSGPRMRRVVAVSTHDGALKWQKEVRMGDAGSVHLVLRDEALYAIGSGNASCRMAYDTGEVLNRLPGRRACTVATSSADSIFYRGAGGTIRVDVASGKAEHIAPMRPPCYEGVIVSGGLLYWGPWKCGCQLSLYGNICLAPAGDFNFRPGADDSRLEPGIGDPRAVEPFDIEPGDWPSYCADSQRSSTTSVALPEQLAQRWCITLPGEGLPAAPVIAGGLILVGDRNGLVRAIDAKDGALRWKAYTGAAIYFPPELWQGRVYAGSADGRVYAFEAATGRLLWQFRAAPAHRWIPVFGKLSSTWPVAGGIVVDDGVVYAAAGIAHYDGTHVYALDAVTGRIKWYNDTSGRLSKETGSGISLQGRLFLQGNALCFAGGNAYALGRFDRQTGRCLTVPRTRASSSSRTAFYAYYPEHDQHVTLHHRLSDGRTLSYVASYDGVRHSTLALLAATSPGQKELGPGWRLLTGKRRPPDLNPPKILWEQRIRAKYNSFIVTPQAVLAAGRIETQTRKSFFLATHRIEDGTQTWQKELPASAVRGGTAMDHAGRVVVCLQDGRVLCFGGARQ